MTQKQQLKNTEISFTQKQKDIKTFQTLEQFKLELWKAEFLTYKMEVDELVLIKDEIKLLDQLTKNIISKQNEIKNKYEEHE